MGYLNKRLLQARSAAVEGIFCKKLSFESITANLKCVRDLRSHHGCWINFKNRSYCSSQQTFVGEERLTSPKDVCAGGYITGNIATRSLLDWVLVHPGSSCNIPIQEGVVILLCWG